MHMRVTLKKMRIIATSSSGVNTEQEENVIQGKWSNATGEI